MPLGASFQRIPLLTRLTINVSGVTDEGERRAG